MPVRLLDPPRSGRSCQQPREARASYFSATTVISGARLSLSIGANSPQCFLIRDFADAPFASTSLWGKVWGLHACSATFSYILPLPSSPLSSFVFFIRVERKGLPRDNSPALGAGGLPFKSGRPDQMFQPTAGNPSKNSGRHLSNRCGRIDAGELMQAARAAKSKCKLEYDVKSGWKIHCMPL